MSLLLSPWTWVAIAFASLGVFSAVQTSRLDHEKTAFAQFRADTERLGAEAKVKAARQEALQAKHAQEALDGLQTRLDAMRGRYDRLRANPGSSGVPNLASAAGQLGSCGPKPLVTDPTARFLAELEAGITGIFEAGDAEIAKYVQLYQLDLKNAAH